MYKKLMSDPRIVKIERLPINDDAAADDFGKSAYLEEFLNTRGTSHQTTKR